MSAVIVYNLDGTELHRVTVKHAIKMLVRQVARVTEADPFRTFGPYPYPRAVELTRYVFTRWLYDATGTVMYSRSGVLRRDRFQCAYCGRSATTVDHVVPRCQGGPSTWTNVVAACVDCNHRKDGRTPREAGMRLQWDPHVPTLAQLRPRRL